MPSSQTKLDVFNLALDLVKDTALQNPQDSAPTARWLNRNWQQTVETTLRAYPWNFAKKFFSLPAEATAPIHSWTYAYKPPAGALRVLSIRRNGDRFGILVPHELVGNLIYTDEPPPLKVACIMDVSANTGAWDPLFVEIVRCKLALGMAGKFTSKAKYIDVAKEALSIAQAQAELIDAFEGSPEPVEQFDIIRVRGDTSTRPSWR